MPLLLLLTVSILQWGILYLPGVHPEHDATVWLYGNLQIIIILFVYRVIKKYVRINMD